MDRPTVERLQTLIESRQFEAGITTLIVINAITLGFETSPTVMSHVGPLLETVDHAILAVFVVELLARLAVSRLAFFRDPWRLFDTFVVGIALAPATGELSVLRALRILRVLRIVGMISSLRRVVAGLVGALPGMGSIMLLLLLVYYIFSVMATNLFGKAFPDWFGTIGLSAYTLFQIMTLEGWSMDIVRPVMEVYPLSWLFFIPFIISTTFTVLNLFIGIIVSSMQEQHDTETATDRHHLQSEQEVILAEIRSLREEMGSLQRTLRNIRPPAGS